VVIEAHYTTFARSSPSEKALEAILPCGVDYFRDEACARPEVLDEEIARMAALGDAPFVRFLRASRAVRCGGDPSQVEGWIPRREEARSFEHQRDALEAAWRLGRGDGPGAVEVAERALADGDPKVAVLLAPSLVEANVQVEQTRHLLEGAVRAMDDAAPADVRAVLALACVVMDDGACVRFHGLRAAERGSQRVVPALMWLHAHAPTAQGRADADAWIEALAHPRERPGEVARNGEPGADGDAAAGREPGDAGPTVKVFDVGARFAQLSAEQPDTSDISDAYYRAPNASVHMHIMAEEQTCPLHIHRRTNEATVIVDGTAEVTHVWGDRGKLETKSAPRGPGWLIASPPFCGHRFENRSRTAKLGNLVFASPGFDGNFYVAADDERMQKGKEPFFYDVAKAVAELPPGPEPNVKTPLPALDGHLSALAVRKGVKLDGRPDAPVFLYVVQGKGALADGHALHERNLVVAYAPAVVRAEGATMAAFLFEPGPANERR
jgi:hypothetical protein